MKGETSTLRQRGDRCEDRHECYVRGEIDERREMNVASKIKEMKGETSMLPQRESG